MIELTQEILVLIFALFIFELTLILYALNDLRKQKFDNRIVWALIIILVSTFGPILYFLIAPRESVDIEFD